MPDDGSGLAGDSGLVPLLLKLGGGGLGWGTITFGRQAATPRLKLA